MLTKIKTQNFKGLPDCEIELGSAVVFVGPNNSGKTTALQALALWGLGLKSWVAERASGAAIRKERPGITLNRRALFALPVPDTKLLWRDLHVRRSTKGERIKGAGHVLVRVVVEGVLGDQTWSSGFEFDYANPESLYCRPIEQLDDARVSLLVAISEQLNVAFLGPMSGLASNEAKIEPGRIDVLIGEGQTAQVLRNLCHAVHERDVEGVGDWGKIVSTMESLFGIHLDTPYHDRTRGELDLTYRSGRGIRLDISAAGRGLQQTLLLLAFLYAKPGAILLLDEPDAHLEVLRQRQIYNVIKRTAELSGGQVVAASHSEVVLDEAAGRDTVIAFLGVPHRINDKKSQLRKSLLSIGFSKYIQAHQVGWILCLEGSTDLAILKTLASRLGHAVSAHLDRPFVDFVDGNHPPLARDLFFGLREAKEDLVGVALFDRFEDSQKIERAGGLTELMWRKREIENYVCSRESLIAWAVAG